jgi:fructose-bisphosphate aldolase / 6-deoxy-5-ketofructose 1-phosphate synthase
MNKEFMLDFVRVTEDAAIASAKHLGCGDKNLADDAAVQAMRKRLNCLDIKGKIVIGEGERDKAPMLYIGEEVGLENSGVEFDFAVDPLECTNAVAYGRENALAVLAVAPKGKILHAPDTYMHKLAVGPKVKGKVDLDWPVEKNLQAIAQALNKEISQVTVVVLKRSRHDELIKEIRQAGARIVLIDDGDVSGAIAPCFEDSGIDVLMGIGAAPEGVLAGAALKCLGGEMQCRFSFMGEDDKKRAKKMGILDLQKKMGVDDLIRSDTCFFVATGVTDGTLLKGVRFESDSKISTQSLIMRSITKTVRVIETNHVETNNIDKEIQKNEGNKMSDNGLNFNQNSDNQTKIPADVPDGMHDTYINNYNKLTHNTGKLMLFAGDQKIEHLNDDFFGEGIANDDNDPEHLFKIASGSKIGCFATQYGLVSQYGKNYPDVNYLLKINSKSNLVKTDQKDPFSKSLISVQDVVDFKRISRLKILAVGYTIYLGSEFEAEMLTEASKVIRDAHRNGLLVVLWIYPRGKAVLDEKDPHLIAGAGGVACCLGADFVKVNYPKKDGCFSEEIFKETVKAAGRTKVIAAGGSSTDGRVFLERLYQQIHVSGACGNATGRNIHQKSLIEAIKMCNAISAITLENKDVDFAMGLLKGF